MKLDRNLNDDGRGKYALLLLRRLADFIVPDDPFQKLAEPVGSAIGTLRNAGLLDNGEVGTEREFFLIRLKDKYAAVALRAYANAAREDDLEWALEVDALADRAENSPWQQRPD